MEQSSLRSQSKINRHGEGATARIEIALDHRLNGELNAVTISAVFWKVFSFVAAMGASVCLAQESSPPSQTKPQVKVNMLNVCTPSSDDQQEIASALARIPKHPAFSPDFEVDRGRSVLDQNANPLAAAGSPQAAGSGDPVTADFVRLRHDFAGAGAYSNVQYSFSRDSEQMVETLVFRVRDAKDLLQVSIDDSASSVTPPAAMLGSTTPANRIRLERFGKPSIVLARCSGTTETSAPDQSKYESLFASASAVLGDYRGVFGVRTLVPEELARITRTHPNSRTPAKKNAAGTNK